MSRISSIPSIAHLHEPTRGRRTRWGPYSRIASLANRPLAITGPLTDEQKGAYALCLRIDEIQHQLQQEAADAAPSSRPRSTSPPPEYDAAGRRTNTRQQRRRSRLEREHRGLVETALETVPGYRPPRGYCRQHSSNSTILREKVYIPVADHPSVNFIGQILGPRGSSLKAMNADSGAVIAIRGRGSVKEGRGRRGQQRRYDDDHESEPLHCLVTADTAAKMDRAKELVGAVIETAITTPECENERKRNQLRDLAMMNGTFRDDEGRRSDWYRNGGGRFLTGGTSGEAVVMEAPAPPAVGGKSIEGADTGQLYRQLMEDIGGKGDCGTAANPSQTPRWTTTPP